MITKPLAEMTKVNTSADDEAEEAYEWPDKYLYALHRGGMAWASAALDTYTGNNLDAALKISVAIANFTAMLQDQ